MAKRRTEILHGVLIRYRILNLFYLIVFGGTHHKNINGNIKGLLKNLYKAIKFMKHILAWLKNRVK